MAHMDPRFTTSKEVLLQMQEESVEDSEEQAAEREMSGWQIWRHTWGTSLSSIPSWAVARLAVAAKRQRAVVKDFILCNFVSMLFLEV
jgi:hypothetical protein